MRFLTHRTRPFTVHSLASRPGFAAQAEDGFSLVAIIAFAFIGNDREIQVGMKWSYMAVKIGNAAAEQALPTSEASQHLIIDGAASSGLAGDIE